MAKAGAIPMNSRVERVGSRRHYPGQRFDSEGFGGDAAGQDNPLAPSLRAEEFQRSSEWCWAGEEALPTAGLTRHPG